MHSVRDVCAGWSVAWLFVVSSVVAADKATVAEMIAEDQPVVWWRCDAAKDAVTSVAVPSCLADFFGRIVGAVKFGVAGPRPSEYPAFAADNRAIEFAGDGGVDHVCRSRR